VENVDTINFTYRANFAYGPRIDLRGGEIAPGAIEEADGSSEIEMEINAPDSVGLFIIGTDGQENVEAGTLPDGRIGVNLNADEATPDVDVSMPASEGETLGGQLLGGNDRFDASGGSLLPGSPAAMELFLRSGGDGADELIVGSVGSYAVGGKGRDTIVGGPGPDRTLSGGPGDDLVLARAGLKDGVQCGEGDDRYTASGSDRVASGCERRLSR
jgi:hypothetical protein